MPRRNEEGFRYERGPRDEERRGRDFLSGQDRPRDDQGRFMSDYAGEYPGDREAGPSGYYRSRDDDRGGESRREYRGEFDIGGDDYQRDYFRGDYRGRGYARGDSRGFGRGRDDASGFSSGHEWRGGRDAEYEDDDDLPMRGGNRERERERLGYYADEDDEARERWEREQGGRGYEDAYESRRGGYEEHGWQGRGRFDRGDDDDDRRGRGRQMRDQDRPRDDEGRFTRSSGYGDDRDEYRGERERGHLRDDHRGWHGDHRRHAQAARLGWRHRDR